MNSSSLRPVAPAQSTALVAPPSQDTIALYEASRAVYVRIVGRGTGVYGPTIVDFLQRAADRGGRISAYFDFESMDSYDASLREQLQTWFRNNLAQLDELNVLARSPLVQAGVQIANVMLKGRIHSARNISELQTRARAQGIDFN